MSAFVPSRRFRFLAAVLWALAASVALLASAGGAQAQNGLSGIDVSNWQRQIDWIAVAGTGNSFVFAKATEGTTFTDLTFPLNRSGSTVLGMRFGAYHMGRPAGSSDAAVVASATAQADYFLSVATPLRGELLPVLDVEYDGGLSVARLSLWVQTWLGQVVARTGLKPIVYVSPNFWKTKLGDSPVVAAAGHKLWIAHWTAAALPILPGASWGGLGWSFWQWSNCQKIPGITGCVDGDRFNGSSLSSVIVPAYPAGSPTSTTAPAIVGGPQAGKLLAALPGTWDGGKPVAFSYQWQRCDAAGHACAAVTAATAPSYTPIARRRRACARRPRQRRHPSGKRVGGLRADPRRRELGGAGGTAPKPKTLPVIQGANVVGQTLAAQVGTWTGSPTSYSYQWRRCTPPGTTACAAIPGAGGDTYTTTPGDIGSLISLTVTAIGKGGAGSGTSAPTAIIVAAPVPTPALGTTIALPGQAGAVTTVSSVAIATWQPGALPNQAAVGLVDTTSHLSLKGTSVRLSFGATAPLPWPIDVQYPNAPAERCPASSRSRASGSRSPSFRPRRCPTAQVAGTYRDPAGTLHLLTRTAGRIALFAAGKWGDPRYATALKPRVALVNHVGVEKTADGGLTVFGRITLDSQAHLYVTLLAANGTKLLLPQKGARIGWWLQGKPAKTLQALQLQPGALPFRLRVPAAQLRAKGRHTLRIVALDPYGRKSALVVKLG